MNNNTIKKDNKAGIYLHIPFCLSKCDYCDFVSFAGIENKAEYISALILDIKQKAAAHKLGVIDTIYFGGGTPSILDVCQLESILNALKENFTIDKNAEITIEVNPKTANKAKLEAFKNIGFNRLSVGVQSFSKSELDAVSRAHTKEEAEEILAAASEVFSNFSCDLMLGLPTSTMASVFQSVKKALSFAPTHISLYGLQVEDGTKLFENVQNGLVIPREDTLADMFELCENLFKENGYCHYEISNFAKKGFESRHNMGYWKLKDYLGIGVSAHSLIGNQRFYAASNMAEYIAAVQNNCCELLEETLSAKEAQKEFVMLGFRLSEGIDLEKYRDMFDLDFESQYQNTISKFAPYLEITKTHIRIQEKYFYISNQIISEFM